MTTIARLAKRLHRLGITQDAVAAACVPPVTRTMVCKVLNGRAKSARVVVTAQRLALEKQAHALREIA